MRTAWPAALTRSADLRYHGQGFELRVNWGADAAARFHRLHAQTYGYSDPKRTVEIVTVRVQAVVHGHRRRVTPIALSRGDGSEAHIGAHRVFEEARWRRGALYDRSRLCPGSRIVGPAVVVELSATTYLPMNWIAAIDGFGNLVLTPDAKTRARR